MDALSRRHLFGAAGALASLSVLGPDAWAQAKDRLVIGMSLEPPVLDPTKNAAAAIREVTTPSIFESLGRIDRTGAIGPGLAESWNISEDGKEYVFKLRQGVKFHDGEALDAAVVKFSLDRLFAADSTNPAKSLYTDIDKVEVVDPSTVKVTLKSPNSFLLYSLSLGDAGIMHPKSAPTNDKNPVGTGPFMFKERKEGDSITLVKSPTYRDPGFDQAQHGDLQDRQGSFGAGERLAGGRRRCLPGLPGARAGRAPEEGSALRRRRRHDRGRGDPGDQQRQEAVQRSQGAPGDRPRHQPRGADLGRVGLSACRSAATSRRTTRPISTSPRPIRSTSPRPRRCWPKRAIPTASRPA